jgi:hypothetical protein
MLKVSSNKKLKTEFDKDLINEEKENIMTELEGELYSYERYIDGLKVVVKARNLEEANKKFEDLLK